MYDLVAIGEMLIDFTVDRIQDDNYPVMASHPGGAVANFLAVSAKNGLRTALISKLGDDAFGKLLLDTVAQCNIDTKGIKICNNAFTTLAFVTRDKSGDRTFSFARKPGADILLSDEDIDYSIAENTAVLHFGTVGMTDEPSRSTHKKVIEYAKKKGVLISCDPNLRLPLWKDENDAKEQMLWALSVSDFVKISDNEVAFLFGLTPEEGLRYILREFGVKLVFVTLGKDGAMFGNKNGIGSVANFEPEEKTIDTTGAGDIFGGSAMYRIIKSGKAPDAFTRDELAEIAAFACKNASISTTKLGGISSIPKF